MGKRIELGDRAGALKFFRMLLAIEDGHGGDILLSIVAHGNGNACRRIDTAR